MDILWIINIIIIIGGLYIVYISCSFCLCIARRAVSSFSRVHGTTAFGEIVLFVNFPRFLRALISLVSCSERFPAFLVAKERINVSLSFAPVLFSLSIVSLFLSLFLFYRFRGLRELSAGDDG